jgi:small-conductance mechanosensitive channel
VSFESLAYAWGRTKALFATIPVAVYALALLVAAIIAALIVHRLIMDFSRRALARHSPRIHALIQRMRGPLRLALILLAVSLALAILPFQSNLAAIIAPVVQLAFISLAGWMTFTCANILSDMYLKRYDLNASANVSARKHVTQVRVLKRTLNVLIVVVTVAAALMTFDAVRQYGIGLFASAGIAGIIAGLAARPVLSNLLAGIQLAVSQPIRIDDSVVIENEAGRIEDITSTFVVVKLWDLRRMIVPLSYFIEKPFENWTRETTNMIGSIFIYADYSVPVERVREKAAEIVCNSKFWDGETVKLHVTDAKAGAVELRILVSARDSSMLFELRCEVREQMIAFLQSEFPGSLPRQRTEQVPGLAGV